MKPNGTRPRALAVGTRAALSLALVGLAALLQTGEVLAAKPANPGSGAGKFTCSIADPGPITAGTEVTFSGTLSGSRPPYIVTWTFPDATPSPVRTTGVAAGVPTTATTTFSTEGPKTVLLNATDSSNGKPKTCSASLAITVQPADGGQAGPPTARGDTYATVVGKTLEVAAATVSGVLYNDFDVDPVTGEQVFGSDAGLTAVLVSGPSHGTLSGGLNSDGSFTYVPNGTQVDNENDSFTYRVEDLDGELSDVAIVNIHTFSDQPDFKIMMNYELGMHCTGFEFSYCCVLPPYNSIVAQVVKPQTQGSPESNADFPRLLEGDPNNGLDGLGRQTVLRDYDGSGNFQKYYLEYYHDAQPRREGNMPKTFNSNAGTSTLISDIEGNSMLYWNTPYDSAQVDTTGSITGVPGKLVTGTYQGIPNVVLGNADYTDPTDNYANGWLNHFYIYQDLEGSNPTGTSLERDKIRLGVTGHVEYPANVGAALQPMGPVSS
ncbi:MAG: Ig-like domain-containing protein, partial [Bdellovibrio bacteriovorus]